MSVPVGLFRVSVRTKELGYGEEEIAGLDVISEFREDRMKKAA